MIRTDSSWSGLPHSPNIIAPRQSGLTLTPVRPSVRILMSLAYSTEVPGGQPPGGVMSGAGPTTGQDYPSGV